MYIKLQHPETCPHTSQTRDSTGHFRHSPDVSHDYW